MEKRNLNTSSLFPESEIPGRFRTALERYGVWPTTIWEIDHKDKMGQTLTQIIGDEGEQRAECFTRETQDLSVYRGKVLASVFSPALAAYLLNCYAPQNGICFDPFAGGGTRAIMAAAKGLRYIGCEIRIEECRAVLARCRQVGASDSSVILCADACVPPIASGVASFLLTCPPYFDLERYEGGKHDLSMLKDYSSFLAAIQQVISEARRILRPGSIACWVVGMTRNNRGELLPLHHDIARIHRELGFLFREEIVVHHRQTGAMQRVGNFEKGRRHLVRVHEYALIFQRDK
jgi:tRNA G10  N-methylase Trm11